jgi:hypothetical protein
MSALLFPGEIQHSNPNLPLIDSSFVKGGLRTVTNILDLTSIPIDQTKRYVTRVYVAGSTNKWYTLLNGTDSTVSDNWIVDPVAYTLPTATNDVKGGVSISSTGGLNVTTPGALSVNANNGLSIGDNNVQLGGPLTKATNISGGGFNLTFGINTNNQLTVSPTSLSTIAGVTDSRTLLTASQTVALSSGSNGYQVVNNKLLILNTSNSYNILGAQYTSQLNELSIFGDNTSVTLRIDNKASISGSISRVRFLSSGNSILNSIITPTGASLSSHECTMLGLGTTSGGGTTNGSSKNWAAGISYVAATSTNYANYIKVTIPSVGGTDYLFKCTQSGTSGSTPPSFTSGSGDVITDNTVQWTNKGAITSATADYNYQLGNLSFLKVGKFETDSTTYKFNAVLGSVYGIYIKSIKDQFDTTLNCAHIDKSYGLYLESSGATGANIDEKYGIYQADTTERNVFNGRMNLSNVPSYANDGAADADTNLKTGDLYTVSRVVKIKP